MLGTSLKIPPFLRVLIPYRDEVRQTFGLDQDGDMDDDFQSFGTRRSGDGAIFKEGHTKSGYFPRIFSPTYVRMGYPLGTYYNLVPILRLNLKIGNR